MYNKTPYVNMCMVAIHWYWITMKHGNFCYCYSINGQIWLYSSIIFRQGVYGMCWTCKTWTIANKVYSKPSKLYEINPWLRTWQLVPFVTGIWLPFPIGLWWWWCLVTFKSIKLKAINTLLKICSVFFPIFPTFVRGFVCICRLNLNESSYHETAMFLHPNVYPPWISQLQTL